LNLIIIIWPGPGPSGSGAAGSSLALINSNPKLERILDDIRMLLDDLKESGVTTKFDYIIVDNIQTGMDKLNKIKSSVSM
jgi:hypothetical protein